MVVFYYKAIRFNSGVRHLRIKKGGVPPFAPNLRFSAIPPSWGFHPQTPAGDARRL
ncbi:hypothetical protein AGMMS49546_01640 [Spirochaetia bacterium]|nr:hypothetical protein AGMMS49546_01640 [Spirochaetia bacterium]